MNLKARYGDKYRISREEGADRHDAAGFIIPCKRGHVYRHSSALLGVATNGRGPIVKQLAALPGVRITQDGSDGVNAVFSPDQFAAVAAIVRPKWKRKLSDRQKAVLAAGRKPFKRKIDVENERSSELGRDRMTADGQTVGLAA
jgi:hypothetical protein